MSIGRINGPMLQPNLERQGINIALDANLTYWDVNNRYVGINTTVPGYTLDVRGNVRLGNVYVQGSSLTTDTGYKLNLGNIANITISGGSANSVAITDGLGNLSFTSLTTLFAITGLTGNSITLGSNSVGSYSNAITLTSQTTIANAVALLNQNLGNVTANVATLLGKTYSNSNVAAYITTYSGNISANVTTSNIFVGNVSGNINGNLGTFSNISGNIATSYQPYINGLGTLSNLTVSGITTVSNVVASGTYSGNIVADTITPYQTNVVVFTNNTAMKIPSGGASTRPNGIAGYFRYNSDSATIEFYNGTTWIQFNNQIVDQQISPDGINNSFALSQSATATGLLVSINGTIQRPGGAYTVSGSTITFAEVPLITDIVDVRYIATAGTTTLDYSIVDVSNVAVGTSNVIIDSFNSSLYRSAEYVISSSNGTDASMSTVLLIQNNGTASIGVLGNVNTGVNYLTFYANTSGSTVNFMAKGTIASNQLRVQRTYFNV